MSAQENILDDFIRSFYYYYYSVYQRRTRNKMFLCLHVTCQVVALSIK